MGGSYVSTVGSRTSSFVDKTRFVPANEVDSRDVGVYQDGVCKVQSLEALSSHRDKPKIWVPQNEPGLC